MKSRRRFILIRMIDGEEYRYDILQENTQQIIKNLRKIIESKIVKGEFLWIDSDLCVNPKYILTFRLV